MTLNRRGFLQGAGAAVAASSLSACGGYNTEATDGVPRSAFDEDSTAEEVTEGLDLKGKLAVVTGCTSGIGFETMRVLAMRGAYVVGTSRSLQRAQAACNKVIGITSPVVLDLADPESVVRCADSIRSLNSAVDILVCNAGYRGGGNDIELVNGVEKHFAINHLGHFILVNRLLDRLVISWQGRIVIVASRTSYRDAPESGILFDDLDMQNDYSDAMAYGHSKLANVLFALELGRILRGSRITANALHPGVINTEIDRHQNSITQFAFGVLTRFGGKTVEQGAATSCFVATSKLLGSTSGRYFEDCNAVNVLGRNHLTNMPMADKLWLRSEELTADYLVTPQRPEAIIK
ncbi:MAG: SDR family NAD(P)-dependent oxidoreductase [Proteobacteria bacterium]|nr:SDR family NAD(P)-dependent oxidoreductase [Pseudomonadota bacterium]